MKKAPKAADKFRQFVELEERAASLYRHFAGLFLENVKLSWFWVEMSMEEKQHAGFLEFCAAEDVITSGLPGKDIIRKLDKLFTRMERRAHREHLSLDDAFLIAAEIESSEINNIYRHLIGPVQGSWYILRKKIETSTSGHMQALLDGARKFGVSSSTIEKIERLQERKAS